VTFNELTVRKHAQYLALVDRYDNESDAWTVRLVAFVMAARDAGIVEGLPDEFATGDLLELPAQHTHALIGIGAEIAAHIRAAIAPPTEGES